MKVCPEVSVISDFFLELLDPSRQEEVRAHLEKCVPCRKVLTEMEEKAAALEAADPLGQEETD